MSEPLLHRLAPGEVPEARRRPVDPETLAAAAEIVEDVRARGEAALREHAERLGDLEPGAPLVLDRAELERSADALPAEQRALLGRVAGRIRRFAEAQLECLLPLHLELDSGSEGDPPEPSGAHAGHTLAPVERAGCYVPGGRYPLPSTALMTVIPARVAGVEEVWVASPRPGPVTRAAAAIAGADGLLAAGGAQAIAALAFGTVTPAVDLVCGPGNRWVTAAKKHLFGEVGIDMLAGPSELVVVADAGADPAAVAADLLGQAEHDDDALPVLLASDGAVIDAVEAELARQLADLPTAATARAALANGFAATYADLDEAAALVDRLAPEHLSLALRDPHALARRVRHYGALFLGDAAAEVLGDYGVGPNHTLPTGGDARRTGGLSVLTFLRVRTWLEGASDPRAVADAAALGRLEGLEAHARSAERRGRS